MKRYAFSAVAWVVALMLVACSGGTPPLPQALAPVAADGTLPVVDASQVRALCPPASQQRMRCHAIARTDLGGFSAGGYHGDDLVRAFAATPACGKRPPYCPNSLLAAYKLPAKGGTGMTIAIVDAYGYGNIATDLATYRKAMGLKACTGSCFRIVNQEGATSPLPPGSPAGDDWYGEKALDVDMVSAICPNCHIVLVETNDDFSNNLQAGVRTAATVIHANIVSMSFGAPEYASSDPTYATAGVLYVASAGDSGAGTEQPCAFTTVVCVGGTQLTAAINARGWSEIVWNTLRLTTQCGGDCGATGSGCSSKVAAPSWESGESCGNFRAETDLSANASVSTPVAVFSSHEGGWGGFGGTSAAAPMIAGMFALAGNAHSVGGPQYVWQHHSALYGVVKGNNIDATVGVTCPSSWPSYICNARAGYDGPTGWGTPNGLGAL